MSTIAPLTEKQQELIAVGVSVAAGCKPCTAFHVKAARAAGASDADIRQAVDDALRVRRNATDLMARLADKLLGSASGAPATALSEQSLIGELVSAGAALAVNCGDHLEAHVIAARTFGANEHHIQTTLVIARAVKNMAAKKVEEIADKTAPAGDCCTTDRDCQSAGDGQPNTTQGCSCAGAPAKPESN
jgi:4-carboxymuconolactone decarboxylase